MLRKISRWPSGGVIVAHLATVGTFEPLCQARLRGHQRWVEEGDRKWAAERDCKNCELLAVRDGLR